MLVVTCDNYRFVVGRGLLEEKGWIGWLLAEVVAPRVEVLGVG